MALFRMESISSSYALEYQIDLASYFRLSDTTVYESSHTDELSQAPININDDVCDFTLQGSGLEDHEIKVVVSIRAALKIYEHTERKSAILTIKEIQIPSKIDSKDARLMTSILSFEPSGVDFSDDPVDGELSSGDYITVSTPTLMTWDANWQLNAEDVSDALSVVWKENEGDVKWQTCQYGKDFNGIIDISYKEIGTRIVLAYLIKHFCCFSIRSCLGLKAQAYALCAMSKSDRDSHSYGIHCSICNEHPKYSQWLYGFLRHSINNDCFIAYQDVLYDGDSNSLLPAEFNFTEYKPDHNKNYTLKPNEDNTKVVVLTVVPKYEYIVNSNVNVGNYVLTKGLRDEGIRTRIILKLKDWVLPNPLWITVTKVCGFLIVAFSIITTSIFSTGGQFSAIFYSASSKYGNAHKQFLNDTI